MSPKSRTRKRKNAPHGDARALSHHRADAEPARRYTPPSARVVRICPTSHKALVVLVVAGMALFFLSEANVGHIHNYRGHLWYLVGVTIAASSMWWFGLFDRPV